MGLIIVFFMVICSQKMVLVLLSVVWQRRIIYSQEDFVQIKEICRERCGTHSKFLPMKEKFVFTQIYTVISNPHITHYLAFFAVKWKPLIQVLVLIQMSMTCRQQISASEFSQIL